MRLSGRLLQIYRVVFVSIFISICACAKAQDNSSGDNNIPDTVNNNQEYDYTKLTPEYLRIHDPNYLFFRTFNEAFPELSKLFPLNSDEEKIVGNWNSSFSFNYGSPDAWYIPFFSPNKLLIIFTDISLDKSENTKIQHLFGVWTMKGKTVEGKLFCFAIIKRNDKTEGWDYSFFKLKNEIECDLINIQNIHKDGYTLKPFNDIPIPEEIQEIGNIRQPLFKGQLASRYFQTKNLDGTIDYNFFKFLPELAKNRITGEMIATDPDKYQKYLSPWAFGKYK